MKSKRISPTPKPLYTTITIQESQSDESHSKPERRSEGQSHGGGDEGGDERRRDRGGGGSRAGSRSIGGVSRSDDGEDGDDHSHECQERSA